MHTLLLLGQLIVNQQEYGNTTYYNGNDYSSGESFSGSSQTYGNTRYDTRVVDDGQGNTATRNCTSTKTGNVVWTTCY